MPSDLPPALPGPRLSPRPLLQQPWPSCLPGAPGAEQVPRAPPGHALLWLRLGLYLELPRPPKPQALGDGLQERSRPQDTQQVAEVATAPSSLGCPVLTVPRQRRGPQGLGAQPGRGQVGAQGLGGPVLSAGRPPAARGVLPSCPPRRTGAPCPWEEGRSRPPDGTFRASGSPRATLPGPTSFHLVKTVLTRPPSRPATAGLALGGPRAAAVRGGHCRQGGRPGPRRPRARRPRGRERSGRGHTPR